MTATIEPTLIIGLESLKKLFAQNSNPKHYYFNGSCHNCGRAVEVKIDKTSGGYGLLGGVLYEPEPHNFLALCINCYEKYAKLT